MYLGLQTKCCKNLQMVIFPVVQIVQEIVHCTCTLVS